LHLQSEWSLSIHAEHVAELFPHQLLVNPKKIVLAYFVHVSLSLVHGKQMAQG
jgi:hypothetical protein